MARLHLHLLMVSCLIFDASFSGPQMTPECMVDLPPEGILRNTDYSDANCTWRIVAPRYHVIQFSIIRLRFLGTSNKLQIFEGMEPSSRLLLDLPEPGKKYWTRSLPDAFVNVGVRSPGNELIISQTIVDKTFDFFADYFPVRSDSCPFTNQSKFCEWENMHGDHQKWKLQQVLGSSAAVVETPKGPMPPIRTFLKYQREFRVPICLSFRFCQTFEQQELRILGIPKQNKSRAKLLLRKVQAYGPKWLPMSVTIPAEFNLGIEVLAATSGNAHFLMQPLTAITALNIVQGECAAVPEKPNCDFTSGLCSWTQDVDDCYNWQLNLEGQFIAKEKPGRHDWFLSVELKTVGGTGCTARLLSMSFPGGESACVRFCFVVKSGMLSVKVYEIATGREKTVMKKDRGLWDWAEVSVWSDTDYMSDSETLNNHVFLDILREFLQSISCCFDFTIKRPNQVQIPQLELIRRVNLNHKVVFEAEKGKDWLWVEIDDVTIVKDACQNESVTVKLQTSFDVSYQHLRFEYMSQSGTCLSAYVLHRGVCESEYSRRVWIECGENLEEWRYICISLVPFCPSTEAIIQISSTTQMKKQIQIRNAVFEPGYCNRPQNNVSCTFEDDFCSWLHPDGENGAFWQRTFASKHLPSHGPLTDKTTEDLLQPEKTSGYIYCAQGYRNGTAVLFGVIPASSSVVCVSFWYYMHGHVGGLRVYTRQPPTYTKGMPVWQRYGNQGSQWNKGSISLKSAGKTRVLFECDRPDTYLNKIIALDDIIITTGSC